MKGSVTISRNSRDEVTISLRDEASSIVFAEARMTVETFGYVISGLAEQECQLILRGLPHVGKKLVVEDRRIECPLSGYDRDALVEWLKENAQEEGWILDTYLGSQSSVAHKDGKTILNYRVRKYV